MSATIQIPLNLPDVKVLSAELTAEGVWLIKVESTLEGTRCHRCGREIGRFHGWGQPIRLRHLPILEQKVYLELRPKRYRCEHCAGRPTTTQRCEWYQANSPHTQAFDRWLLKCLINSTVQDVSAKLEVGPSAVMGALSRLGVVQNPIITMLREREVRLAEVAHVVVGGEGLGDVDQVHRQQEVQPVQPGQAGRVVLDGGGVVGPRDEGARPAQHAGVVVGVLRLEATGEGGRGGGGQQQRGDLQAHGLLPAVKAAR